MKRIYPILLYLFVTVFVLEGRVTGSAVAADKSVLIINSYREEIEWSARLDQQIKAGLKDKYPDIMIYADYLNADIAVSSGMMDIKMRTILRSVDNDSDNGPSALDLSYATIFQAINNLPDLVVFIGDEAWNLYKSYLPYMGQWKDIPVVLVAVDDLSLSYKWNPAQDVQWQYLQKTDSRHFVYSTNDLDIGKSKLEGLKIERDQNIYNIHYDFNVTGVICESHLMENLKLIHTLLPDLRELVFIDDMYYSVLYEYRSLQNEVKKMMPGVSFSTLFHTRMNTDSIYDEMLKPVENKAILTYSWQVSPVYSRKSGETLDSLFRNVQTVPIFSLMPKEMVNNYEVGGVCFDMDECIEKTLTTVNRVLNGERADQIPFEYVKGSDTFLNKTALDRYGLSENATALLDVTYGNIPLTFFEKYEKENYVTAILLVLLVGYLLLLNYRHRHGQRLNREAARYKSLYDELQLIYGHANFDFAIYDEEGNRIIRMANEAKKNKVDYHNLLAKNIFESSLLPEELKKQIKANRPVNTEIPVPGSQEEIVHGNVEEQTVYQLIVKPLHGIKRKSFNFIVIVINLTPLVRERKEKERIESLFNFASNSSQVGVAYYNLTDRKGFASKSWYKNLNEKIIDKIEPSYQHVALQDRILLWDYIQKMKSAAMRPLQKDIQVTDDDGVEHWVRQYIFQMKFDLENQDIQVVELNINVDSQKQSELKLAEVKKQAEKANQEAEEFLANISHEVRTPLNAIVGFSNVMASCDDPEEVIQLGDIIKKNNLMLTQLINDILNLSKIDSGKVELQYSDVDMNEIMISLRYYADQNFPDKNLIVNCILPEERCVIKTDTYYFRQVMMHLIGNAMKFTDKGSITFGYYRKDSNYYFYVEDTGCGIPDDKHDIVFKSFEKLDTFSQGSGLGLSLCKSIILKMGGEIGLSSKIGEGTTVWFILPDYLSFLDNS